MLEELVSTLRMVEFVEREKRLKGSVPQKLAITEQVKTPPLHIVYILTHVGICGGVKVILQHANGLKRLGCRVTLLSHFSKPNWYPIEVDYITIPFGVELTRAIPLCDVIVATYWDHIHACVESGIAPVVYFEQGDFHLFEPELDPGLKSLIEQQLKLPPHIITISHPVQSLIKDRFGRDSLVFPNAIDREAFYSKQTSHSKKYMMIVGSYQSKFKGIDDLLHTFQLVKHEGYELDLLWLSPDPPPKQIGEVYIAPSQSVIGELYRKAHLFVCGSHYEAFSLPCLEAMACGTPVVTTKTPGVEEYAIDGYNCLMAEPGDAVSLAKQIIRLLSDEALYMRLVSAGQETAKQFSWDHILQDLLRFYEQIAPYRPIPKYRLEDWKLSLHDKEFLDQDAQEKLERFLLQTEANEVYGPVEYNGIPGIPLVVWELLAKRNSPLSNGYKEKVFLKATGIPSTDWLGKEVALKFQKGEYREAILKARQNLVHTQSGSLHQGVLVRWVILCLIQLEQYQPAEELLAEALITHPFYTDLYYLDAKLASIRKDKQREETSLSICQFLKEAAYYPEFLNIDEM